jgi:hypothetical protein
MMEFLLSHWHCLLPVLGIVAAMFFMRGDKSKPEDKNAPIQTTVYQVDTSKDEH